MSPPAEDVASIAAPGSAENGEDALAHAFGLPPAAVRRLQEAGYSTVEAVQALEDVRLRELGLDPSEIARVRAPGTPVEAGLTPAETAERGVDRWVDRMRSSGKPKRRTAPTAGARADSASVLKKWVQGDDRAMEDWIQSAEPTRGASRPAPSPPLPSTEAPSVVGPDGGAAPTPGPGAPAPTVPANLIEREETVVRWLTDLLDRVKSEQFDPSELLQEVQDLHRSLFEEQAKRKQLEEELEHVKRGSIAVIKYVRSREAKARDQAIQAKDAELAELRLKLLAGGGGPAGELGTPATPSTGADGASSPAPPAVDVATAVQTAERKVRDELAAKESQALDREAEVRRRVVQLEAEIRNLRSELGAAQQREELRKQDSGKLSENLTKLMGEADARERELMLRENELRTRFDEIRLATEDLERKRAPLASKERELERWEAQLQATRQTLELEARRIEGTRGGEAAEPVVDVHELRKLEKLKLEISGKEAEMKARETYIRSKIEELEALQRQGAGGEAEPVGPAASATSTKVKSGVRRLDDLLFGGIPPTSQMLVNGPAHTGKEILSRLFIAEGLKQNIPAIWVVTDKTYTQIRDDMTQLYPAYPDAERKGMVRYIDLYSRSLGVTQSETGVRLLSVSDKGVLEQLSSATSAISAELKEKFGSYRLAFESISTLTAYLDGAALFRFLQPFTGRRKLDGAVAYYLLETGMHSESDLQTLEHMMDGSINLKVEQLKTFLSVKGISEVQSRAWIGYTFTKKAFSLGSFSLDHIR